MIEKHYEIIAVFVNDDNVAVFEQKMIEVPGVTNFCCTKTRVIDE
jgi:hypothetical protein